jgi:hypothetical protein
MKYQQQNLISVIRSACSVIHLYSLILIAEQEHMAHSKCSPVLRICGDMHGRESEKEDRGCERLLSQNKSLLICTLYTKPFSKHSHNRKKELIMTCYAVINASILRSM